MGEAKRRNQRASAIRKRFGDGPLDLHIFPLREALSGWKLRLALEVLGRKERGELYCLICDRPIAVDLPPHVGFLQSDVPGADVCAFAICHSCSNAAETSDELAEIVCELFGRQVAPLTFN